MKEERIPLGDYSDTTLTKAYTEHLRDTIKALVDLKIDNAIYLVGSTSFGYFIDRYDHLAIIYNKFRYGYQYENFIVWRTPAAD